MFTCVHTLARNLLPASNATTPANSQVSWRCTWGSTLQKQLHEKQECSDGNEHHVCDKLFDSLYYFDLLNYYDQIDKSQVSWRDTWESTLQKQELKKLWVGEMIYFC